MPLLKKEADLNLKEGVAEESKISRKLGKTKILWKGNTLSEGTNVEEGDSICHIPENDNNMLTLGVSRRFIEYIDKESSSSHFSNVFKYGVQLYTKSEKDGFSIHFEEVE